MVFSWLFGEKDKKKTEAETQDLTALLQQAEQATRARELDRAESICRELVRVAPENADAWTLLGVNLIRKGMSDPELRTEAVLSWTRALALRPDDSRAGEHLGVEVEFPDELVPRLVGRLSAGAPVSDDAAAALARIGARAKTALVSAVEAGGPVAGRARELLSSLS